MIQSELLYDALREAGIAAHGLVGRAALLAACEGMPASLFERLGLGEAGGAIVAALTYSDGLDYGAAWGEMAGRPLARLARFARANWYAELAARLKDAAARIRRRLSDEGRDPGSAREWRYFVNSALPEKRLALEAGLGELGLHGLVMLPIHGSAAVLGLLLAPYSASFLFPPDPTHSGTQSEPRISALCEGCGRCVAACPTGALSEDGSFARELCLQHWSSIPGILPSRIEKAWGDRLYGCDICQEACPKFLPDASAGTTRGLLGPGLSAEWLISCPGEEIRAALKKTVLGMSWISVEALKRNARLAFNPI